LPKFEESTTVTTIRTSSLAIVLCLLAAISAETGSWPRNDNLGMPGGQQFDCNQLASMPNAPMSVENCKQMMGAAQAYTNSATDPSAARPGDEAMSCDAIVAEMRTMRDVGLSDGAREENATAAKNYQATIAKQQAEINAYGAAATAAVNAAAAADAATEIATGGAVHGHAAQAVQGAAQAQGRVMGERMAQERKPDEQRVFKAVGNSSAEMGQQMQSNPRYARLIHLAIAKNCKESGSASAGRP
jgi:hypothetical protein